MSLYGGLGLGFDTPKADGAADQGDGKTGKNGGAADTKPKPSTTNWSSSIKMMAPSLRRKQNRKTPAEVAAKLNQLRAAQAASKGARTKTTVVPSTGTANPPLAKKVPTSTGASLSSNTSAEPFLPSTGPTEFKDEYHPKRPNDYENWNGIFERENVEKRKLKEAKIEDERDNERRKASKNTAAIAPPSSLVGEIATRSSVASSGTGSSSLFSSTKLAKPKPVDDIDSQNPFESDSDDGGTSADPFANMPVTGFGAGNTASSSSSTAQARPTAANLQLSGEDAWAARAKMSQARATTSEQDRNVLNNSIGAKMMEKYGWEDGKGLGRTEQGLNTALSVEQTGVRSGVIVNSATKTVPPVPTKSVPPVPARATTVVPAGKPSRVMLLMNLVGPGEVDSDLKGETADECSKFGTVVKCVVHECPPNSTPPEEAVRIFVEFASTEGAKKAVKVMHGRVFGGRTVHAQYYDLSKYLRNMLS